MSTIEQVKGPPKTPGWLNSLMAAAVRSPFSRLVDRGILLLTVVGRRTGRPYTFPVQYVEDAAGLWVLSGAGPEKTWWRNLRPGAPVEVLLRRRVRRGRGVAFTYEGQPEVVERGLRSYVERFPRMARRLGIAADDPAAFADAAARSVMVRIFLDDELVSVPF